MLATAAILGRSCAGLATYELLVVGGSRNLPRAGTWMSMNLLGRQRLAAFGGNNHGIEHLAALAMLMQQGPSTLIHHVGIAPMHQRHHDRVQVEAFLGQDIFVPLGDSWYGMRRRTPCRTSFLSRSASRWRVIPSAV